MRHLTNTEVFYIKELLHGRQVNRGENIVLSGEELLDLQRAFDAEHRSRRQRIPEDWREQAGDFLVEKGAFQLVPGIAGGRMVTPKKDGPKVTIDDVDTLLMLVGDASDLIPED